MQFPPLQTPDGHTLPHPLQLFGSLSQSTQTLLHSSASCGTPASGKAGHGVHWPSTHVSFAMQTLAQCPQFDGSFRRFLQTLLQSEPASGHVTHVPFTQVLSAAQALPQAPQSLGSCVRSAHVPLQFVSVLAQVPWVQT
jgi:hypothetical protein